MYNNYLYNCRCCVERSDAHTAQYHDSRCKVHADYEAQLKVERAKSEQLEVIVCV